MGMRIAERRRVNVLEMKCLRSLVGVLRMDSVRNVLRWFGHVERMDEYRMARRVLMAEVSGGRSQWRPKSVGDGYEGDRG